MTTGWPSGPNRCLEISNTIIPALGNYHSRNEFFQLPEAGTDAPRSRKIPPGSPFTASEPAIGRMTWDG